MVLNDSIALISLPQQTQFFSYINQFWAAKESWIKLFVV